MRSTWKAKNSLDGEHEDLDEIKTKGKNQLETDGTMGDQPSKGRGLNTR